MHDNTSWPGAERVLITDYPSPHVLRAAEANVARNGPVLGPGIHFEGGGSDAKRRLVKTSVEGGDWRCAVEGHKWGDPIAGPAPVGFFDVCLVAECLWNHPQASHPTARKHTRHGMF